MTQRLEAEGSKQTSLKWDDKSNHDDVTKIYVNWSPKGIESICFDYVKSGKPIDGPFHGNSWNTYTHTFEINHLKSEHLESVEGYYTEDKGIQALQFKTNLRLSKPIGYHDGCTKFILAVGGKKIIGFHGSIHDWKVVSSLGAYFTWTTPTRIEAIGSKEGTKWDVGVNQAGITKIHVRSGQKGIQFIKFEYVDKDGHLIGGPMHGSIYRRGSPHVFEIMHDKEYLVSVEGYYEGDDECGVIHALQFKTNIKTSELMGSNTGKKFRLAASGMKIVGFHGYAEKNLNSLGAYFTPLTPTKSECHGIIIARTGNVIWDAGAFEGIRKVSVLWSSSYIRYLRINYENAGKVEKRNHGMNIDGQGEEFVVDFPNEFITSVVGTMNSFSVSSLTFKTSKGRTSQKYGIETSDSVEFVLESKGCAIVGFHGWYDMMSWVITALGAYYYPMPLPPAEKLEAQGGPGGAPWDDGNNFEGVRKIYIGTGEVGIVSVKFVYQNATHEIVVGDHHGNKNLLQHEEFDLDYPCEYLTSVEGSYDVVPGSEEFEVIIMLKFTTNMQTSPCYGLDDDPTFVLHKEGHKIVGFHGTSSNMLHKLGVHVLPISDS